jgi:hypothetical protein
MARHCGPGSSEPAASIWPPRAQSTRKDASGRIAVGGDATVVGEDLPDAFVRLYGAQGTPLWTRTFGIPNDSNRGSGVAAADDGDAFVLRVLP